MKDKVTVTITVTDAIIDRNHVVIKSDAHGASEMGKIYNEKLCCIFEVNNGKIQICHEYLDTINVNKVLEEGE